ncbi:MAG TPA: methyltransferase [Caulobacteraceae bacterium]|jgi:23S rRNA (uracil1939-C5)-methyltransferase|nr:methyltransferase [Caulobacteraceae bacterium]
MGAQGDGVAAGGVMTALTLPGERVGALVAGDRGELIDVIEPSSERTSPPCPHFGVCGGCSLQHWAHEPYLEWKIEKVRTALARVRLEPEVRLAFAAEPGTRRRVALHARREGRGVRLGFKARRSWSVIPIDVCPISLPVIVDALHVLRELAGPFLATPASAPILHVTATDTGLDIDVTGVERPGPSADALSRVGELAATANISRVTRGGEIAYQARASIVQFGPARVALPPGAFLQAVAQAESAMAAILVDAAQGARGIADLYCGAGAFSFRLAAVAPVLAVDASEAAVAALRSATAAAPGLKGIRTEARDLDRRPMLASELKGFDVVVFDPPRAGAAAQAGELARSQVPRVLAVSCNPGTFARDARTLADGGYELRRVEVVDQFLWSPHVELVGIFQRGA